MTDILDIDRATVTRLAKIVGTFALVLMASIAILEVVVISRVAASPPDLPPRRVVSDTEGAKSDSIWYARTTAQFAAQTAAISGRQATITTAINGLLDLVKVFSTALVTFVFGSTAGLGVFAFGKARFVRARAELLAQEEARAARLASAPPRAG